ASARHVRCRRGVRHPCRCQVAGPVVDATKRARVAVPGGSRASSGHAVRREQPDVRLADLPTTPDVGAGRLLTAVSRPALSIAMPTRNRPVFLERALRSVVAAVAPVAEHVELALSDGSDDGATRDVVERVLRDWPAERRYVWNQPALGLVENMNRAVEI